MSNPEVDWILDQLASVVSSVSNDYTDRNGDGIVIKRVDRDDSQVYEGSDSVDMSTPLHTRTGELEGAGFVGASLADVANDPIGTEYGHDREAVVGIRIEGIHVSEWGVIDPAGENGIPFEELKQRVRTALLEQRVYPGAGGTDVTYTDLRVTNEASQSDTYADFYRHDFDVVLNGYEDLP